MSDRPAFVVGNGGHAHVIAAMLGRPVRFVVSQPAQPDEVPREQIFGRTFGRDEIDVYLGVGDNASRRAEFDRLHLAGLRVATCIAPNAWIAPDAVIGEGSVVCPGAIVGSRTILGQNVIVNTLAGVDHDCIVGDDTHISAGVTIGGGVTIGRRCFLAIKSAAISHISIGDDVSLIAGSLLARSLPSGVMAGGNPARIMRGAARPGDEPLAS